MDTKVLDYMLVIAQEKNISKAAERLYISQSSLSRHLQSIEKMIGTKMFLRKNTEFQLTDSGKVFINGAQAILHIEKRTLAQLASIRPVQNLADME